MLNYYVATLLYSHLSEIFIPPHWTVHFPFVLLGQSDMLIVRNNRFDATTYFYLCICVAIRKHPISHKKLLYVSLPLHIYSNIKYVFSTLCNVFLENIVAGALEEKETLWQEH